MTTSPFPDHSELNGAHILIGRGADRSASLCARLDAAHASVIAAPLIETVPAASSAELEAAARACAEGDTDWVVFTSVNAVSAIVSRAVDAAHALAGSVRVAVVGAATAAACESAGISVDLVPETHSGEGLARAFPPATGPQRIVMPRSNLAGRALPEALRHRGYDVLDVTAYETVPRRLEPSVSTDLREGRFDAVVVASSSGADSLAGYAPFPHTVLVAIGEPTERALRARFDGAEHTLVVAAHPDDDGILDALIRGLTGRTATLPKERT